MPPNRELDAAIAHYDVIHSSPHNALEIILSAAKKWRDHEALRREIDHEAKAGADASPTLQTVVGWFSEPMSIPCDENPPDGFCSCALCSRRRVMLRNILAAIEKAAPHFHEYQYTSVGDLRMRWFIEFVDAISAEVIL